MSGLFMKYYDKVKQFNRREDYIKDVNTAKLLVDYCLTSSITKRIFIIGTGLGADINIIKNKKRMQLIGVEPRATFYKEAFKEYRNLGGKLLNMTLGEFVNKSQHSLSGIFLFVHSINHIPRYELKLLRKSMKNSFVIIINPNPELEKTVGKTDKTVISYLTCSKIERILNCSTIFDFFYHPVKIKGKEVSLREAILLISKS